MNEVDPLIFQQEAHLINNIRKKMVIYIRKKGNRIQVTEYE